MHSAGCMHGLQSMGLQSRSTAHPLPHTAGPLPPFEGASEFAAMQMAARAASSTLYAATREGFRRFAMQPSNVSVMVALAWHAYAATYRPHDPLAADIQVQAGAAQAMQEQWQPLQGSRAGCRPAMRLSSASLGRLVSCGLAAFRSTPSSACRPTT